MFKGLNAIDFNRCFKSDADCFEYLMQLKWPVEFSCSKCGCTKAIKGRT